MTDALLLAAVLQTGSLEAQLWLYCDFPFSDRMSVKLRNREYNLCICSEAHIVYRVMDIVLLQYCSFLFSACVTVDIPRAYVSLYVRVIEHCC